jgi:ABC-2 type transport system ATP-binding protein
MEAIEVVGLTKRFGKVTAVDDVSFRVGRGEILGLLGPNGAGKTTLIQLLLGLTTPTSGSAKVLGLAVGEDRSRILARCNFASAYVWLPPNLTVKENLRVFGRLYGIRRPEAQISELLHLFEIPEVLDRVTGSLSSGQQTRVNLCKALLTEPEVLFLDEPTASLDPHIGEKVRATLRRIQRDRQVTMIYTSHNMREVERLCDRIVFLSRGRVVTEGSPAEILDRARETSLDEVFIRIARDGDLRDVAEDGRA